MHYRVVDRRPRLRGGQSTGDRGEILDRWPQARREPGRPSPSVHRENFKLQRFATQEDQLKTPAIGRLGEISVPTLVVIGDEDEKDLARLADKLAAEVPGATKTENANAAHLPSLEHPPLFDQILSDFLAR